MDKQFIEETKEKLLLEKKRLEKDLGIIGVKDSNATNETFQTTFPEYGDDEDENAMEISDYSSNLSVETELEKLLRDINSALERIANNEYHICKYCKSEISQGRLKVRPTSTSCIACKKTLTQEI